MKIYWGKGDICSTYWIKVTKGRSGDDLESDLWGTGLGDIDKWNGGKFGSIWFLGHFILISTMSKTLPAIFIFPFLCSTLEIVSLHVSLTNQSTDKAPTNLFPSLPSRSFWEGETIFSPDRGNFHDSLHTTTSDPKYVANVMIIGPTLRKGKISLAKTNFLSLWR